MASQLQQKSYKLNGGVLNFPLSDLFNQPLIFEFEFNNSSYLKYITLKDYQEHLKHNKEIVKLFEAADDKNNSDYNKKYLFNKVILDDFSIYPEDYQFPSHFYINLRNDLIEDSGRINQATLTQQYNYEMAITEINIPQLLPNFYSSLYNKFFSTSYIYNGMSIPEKLDIPIRVMAPFYGYIDIYLKIPNKGSLFPKSALCLEFLNNGIWYALTTLDEYFKNNIVLRYSTIKFFIKKLFTPKSLPGKSDDFKYFCNENIQSDGVLKNAGILTNYERLDNVKDQISINTGKFQEWRYMKLPNQKNYLSYSWYYKMEKQMMWDIKGYHEATKDSLFSKENTFLGKLKNHKWSIISFNKNFIDQNQSTDRNRWFLRERNQSQFVDGILGNKEMTDYEGNKGNFIDFMINKQREHQSITNFVYHEELNPRHDKIDISKMGVGNMEKENGYYQWSINYDNIDLNYSRCWNFVGGVEALTNNRVNYPVEFLTPLNLGKFYQDGEKYKMKKDPNYSVKKSWISPKIPIVQFQMILALPVLGNKDADLKDFYNWGTSTESFKPKNNDAGQLPDILIINYYTNKNGEIIINPADSAGNTKRGNTVKYNIWKCEKVEQFYYFYISFYEAAHMLGYSINTTLLLDVWLAKMYRNGKNISDTKWPLTNQSEITFAKIYLSYGNNFAMKNEESLALENETITNNSLQEFINEIGLPNSLLCIDPNVYGKIQKLNEEELLVEGNEDTTLIKMMNFFELRHTDVDSTFTKEIHDKFIARLDTILANQIYTLGSGFSPDFGEKILQHLIIPTYHGENFFYENNDYQYTYMIPENVSFYHRWSHVYVVIINNVLKHHYNVDHQPSNVFFSFELNQNSNNNGENNTVKEYYKDRNYFQFSWKTGHSVLKYSFPINPTNIPSVINTQFLNNYTFSPDNFNATGFRSLNIEKWSDLKYIEIVLTDKYGFILPLDPFQTSSIKIVLRNYVTPKYYEESVRSSAPSSSSNVVRNRINPGHINYTARTLRGKPRPRPY